MTGGIDSVLSSRISAGRANPQGLMQSYQQNSSLIDLLALQKLKSEKEAAARQMALQGGGTPPTVREQREQELLQMNKQELAQQVGGVAKKQMSDQQAAMQRMMQGVGGLPAPGVAGMAGGGVVGYAEGGDVFDEIVGYDSEGKPIRASDMARLMHGDAVDTTTEGAARRAQYAVLQERGDAARQGFQPPPPRRVRNPNAPAVPTSGYGMGDRTGQGDTLLGMGAGVASLLNDARKGVGKFIGNAAYDATAGRTMSDAEIAAETGRTRVPRKGTMTNDEIDALSAAPTSAPAVNTQPAAGIASLPQAAPAAAPTAVDPRTTRSHGFVGPIETPMDYMTAMTRSPEGGIAQLPEAQNSEYQDLLARRRRALERAEDPKARLWGTLGAFARGMGKDTNIGMAMGQGAEEMNKYSAGKDAQISAALEDMLKPMELEQAQRREMDFTSAENEADRQVDRERTAASLTVAEMNALVSDAEAAARASFSEGKAIADAKLKAAEGINMQIMSIEQQLFDPDAGVGFWGSGEREQMEATLASLKALREESDRRVESVYGVSSSGSTPSGYSLTQDDEDLVSAYNR